MTEAFVFDWFASAGGTGRTGVIEILQRRPRLACLERREMTTADRAIASHLALMALPSLCLFVSRLSESATLDLPRAIMHICRTRHDVFHARATVGTNFGDDAARQTHGEYRCGVGAFANCSCGVCARIDTLAMVPLAILLAAALE